MMMKSVIYSGLAVLLVISQFSCKKCVECTYTNDIGEEVIAESCKKKANEELENDLNEQWGKYGAVNCTDK